MIFRNAVIKQLDCISDLLHQAIEKAPENKFAETHFKWKYNWNIYHIIETLSFYNQPDPEGFKWASRAGFDWNETPQEDIEELQQNLKKEDLKSYLLEVVGDIHSTVDNFSDIDLASKDGFHWFDSVVHKYIYAISHTYYHLGELAKTLRDWDAEHMVWGQCNL
ncbi:MAG: ClbS/DfsB family four-helix bundle protein [Candidatus Heimdallarchaeota archaeon]|nr:ClbS/DfsB family four-helix bundle protein [Candidatus Heimdallarchaeota archaeon]